MSFHIPFSTKEILPQNLLPEFCSFAIQNANAIVYSVESGKILLQEIQHYLVKIELFEYFINQNTKIDLTITKASLIMLVMLSGHSILSDADGHILTETHGNCCYLSHLEPGRYNITFLEGHHKVLLLTIHPDFILQHRERFKEIQPLIKNYLFKEAPYFNLTLAPIAVRIYKLLKNLNRFHHQHTTDYDKKIISFLMEGLISYQKNLSLRKISNIVQKNKAEEIASFLRDNFLNQIVNHKAKMAFHFCLSEKTMLRLAKKQFGKSLHQKVIELRLLYGLKQLKSTNKSVQEIADLIGYDRHYFSRLFKLHFGIPPGRIRKLDL